MRLGFTLNQRQFMSFDLNYLLSIPVGFFCSLVGFLVSVLFGIIVAGPILGYEYRDVDRIIFELIRYMMTSLGLIGFTATIIFVYRDNLKKVRELRLMEWKEYLKANYEPKKRVTKNSLLFEPKKKKATKKSQLLNENSSDS